MINLNDLYLCPFCGYETFYYEFRLQKKNKKGYHKKYVKCPDCNNVFHKGTLMREMTPKEWAEWLYAHIRSFWSNGSDYYKKVKWEKLFGRLKELGISYSFWESWAKAKTLSAEELRRIINEHEQYIIDIRKANTLLDYIEVKKA